MSETLDSSNYEDQQQIEEKEVTLATQLEGLKIDGKEAEYQNFIKQIENKKGDETYNEIIISLSSRMKQKKYKRYFKKEGYPINTQKKNNFDIFCENKLEITFKEEKEENIKKKEEVVEEKDAVVEEKDAVVEEKESIVNQELLKQKVIIEKLYPEWESKLSGSGKGDNFLEIIRGIRDVDENDSKASADAIKLLVTVEGDVHDIMLLLATKEVEDAKKEGRDVDRKLLESTSVFFKTSFPKADMLSVDDYINLVSSKKSFTFKPNDTTEIFRDIESESPGVYEIDMGHMPPSSSLRAGSDYEFRETVQNNDEINDLATKYIEIESGAKKAMKGLGKFSDKFNDFLNNVQRIKSTPKMEAGDIQYEIGEELNALKNFLGTYLVTHYQKLGLKSGDQLTKTDLGNIFQNSSSLNDFSQKISDKMDVVAKAIQELPEGAYREYEEKARTALEKQRNKEKREKQLRMLNYLKSIGFDMIPQKTTDQIIAFINGSSIGPGLGINGEINLAEGMLGVDTNRDSSHSSPEELAIFAQFVNIMVTGNKEGIYHNSDDESSETRSLINTEHIRSDSGAPVADFTEFKSILRQTGIDDTSGASVGQKNLDEYSRSQQ